MDINSPAAVGFYAERRSSLECCGEDRPVSRRHGARFGFPVEATLWWDLRQLHELEAALYVQRGGIGVKAQGKVAHVASARLVTLAKSAMLEKGGATRSSLESRGWRGSHFGRHVEECAVAGEMRKFPQDFNENAADLFQMFRNAERRAQKALQFVPKLGSSCPPAALRGRMRLPRSEAEKRSSVVQRFSIRSASAAKARLSSLMRIVSAL